MKQNNHVQTVEVPLIIEGRKIATVTVADVGSDKYFKLEIKFADDSFRQLWISWNACVPSLIKKIR